MSEPWRGVAWAAGYCGVSEKTVRRHAARLGARRLGGRLLFKASLIDAGLESLGPRRKGVIALASRARGA